VTSYDKLIPPEVSHDRFYRFIERLARRKTVRTILEIGSSSGEGSTAAFVSGMDRNPSHPVLHCIEMSRVRFAALKQRYAGRSDVHCYNVSTVSPESLPGEAEVAAFYSKSRSNLNNYPLDDVLEWLRQDLEYLRHAGLPMHGIQLIKEEHDIATFDLVLIDGSAFSGPAELNEVYGAGIILLDDVNDIKNRSNYERLRSDPQYRLIAEDWKLRNGYAAFDRPRDNEGTHRMLLTFSAFRRWFAKKKRRQENVVSQPKP